MFIKDVSAQGSIWKAKYIHNNIEYLLIFYVL